LDREQLNGGAGKERLKNRAKLSVILYDTKGESLKLKTSYEPDADGGRAREGGRRRDERRAYKWSSHKTRDNTKGKEEGKRR